MTLLVAVLFGMLASASEQCEGPEGECDQSDASLLQSAIKSKMPQEWPLDGSTTILSAEQTAEYMSWYTEDLLPKWQNKKESSLWTLQTTISIKQPAQKVFDAIMTSNMWPVCYPNTLSVGGFSHTPFTPETPKGMILEKFLWAGAMYSLFRYQVRDENSCLTWISGESPQTISSDRCFKMLSQDRYIIDLVWQTDSDRSTADFFFKYQGVFLKMFF